MSEFVQADRDMVLIPGGEALIGSPDWVLDWLVEQGQTYPKEWFADECPQIRTCVQAYYIDRTPVTVEQFARFVEDTGYRTDAERQGFGFVFVQQWEDVPKACWRRPAGEYADAAAAEDHPVVHISWRDANAYAEWCGKRLPTETEWELASRGYEFRLWPWGNEWSRERANTAEYWAGVDIRSTAPWFSWWKAHQEQAGPMPLTTPVGCFQSAGDSVFGVSDMAGNVYEWTSSLCCLRGDSAKYDPMYKAIEGIYRVVRGGSWMNFRYQTRCSERIYADPSGWSNFALGFRCARDAIAAPKAQ
jgi:sulfatase modifying factor 1